MSGAAPAGETLAGLFLAIFGICAALLGGGCTFMVLMEMSSGRSGYAGNGLFLIISLFVLAGGATAVWAGVGLLRGSFRKG